MAKQRISYVPLDKMDAEMRKEMERCQREGTPRPESSAVRAHVPAAFWFFANSWHNLFRNGVLDHAIKELCRLYVSRSVQCEYCGNQRSVKATTSGALIEDHAGADNHCKAIRGDAATMPPASEVFRKPRRVIMVWAPPRFLMPPCRNSNDRQGST